MLNQSTLRWRLFKSGAFLSLFMLVAPLVESAQLERILDIGKSRSAEGRAAQKKVDQLSDQIDALLREYRSVTKSTEGLKIYNEVLEKQIEGQKQEISDVRLAMSQIAQIERQIVPLMVRMIDSLKGFIELDIPFLLDERRGRITNLRTMLEESDSTTAEKFRRVIEVYQIENDYGRNIEAYKGILEISGNNREVDFLRVGRVALLYQTADKLQTGAWDQNGKKWVELPANRYKNPVAYGLRVARKRVAPDLLLIPVPSAETLQ